jgi:serine/threonine-protein kinase
VLAAAAVVAVGGGVYAAAGQRPPGIAAPALVGVSQQEARERIAAAAKEASVAPPRLEVTGRAYSERIPAGSIVAQDDRPGAHVPASDAVEVLLSLGSAWAAVPNTTGRPTSAAVADLTASGFTVRRRFGPSVSTAAWHVAETDPPAGARVQRPANVVVLVSTGPPRVAVPDVRGDERRDGLDRLERTGLAVRTETAPSTSAEPGTILEVEPPQGTRVRMGETVTVVVAREPRWKALAEFDGDSDYVTEPLIVGSGSRAVLVVENTSFFGLLGAGVDVSWQGDTSGAVELGAGEHVLLEPSESRRVVAFDLRPYGSAYWTLVVEKLA